MRKELRRARERAGLTQAAMAAVAGIDRSTYAHIEVGDRDPSYEVACLIATKLGWRVESLFVPVRVLNQRAKEVTTDG